MLLHRADPGDVCSHVYVVIKLDNSFGLGLKLQVLSHWLLKGGFTHKVYKKLPSSNMTLMSSGHAIIFGFIYHLPFTICLYLTKISEHMKKI